MRRGIRQGCNSSPLLFIMVAKLLAISIKNWGIKGINVLDTNILINQFADDNLLMNTIFKTRERNSQCT